MSRATVSVIAAGALLVACSSAELTSPAAPPPRAAATTPASSAPTVVSTTSSPPTPSTSTSTTSSVASTTTTTSTTTSTTVPLWSAALDLTQATLPFGSSIEGRPLVAERYGELGGRRVLIIGVIHGNEDAGVAIVNELRSPPPPGVELWLVESMNPDGQAAGDRHNARDVDLNRNFPHDWGPIGQPGDGQYAGPGPASEPETLAVVNLITQLKPDVTIWYHQDLNTISPSSGRDGSIRARYSELTGVPLGEITGGTYTGVAATWARRQVAPDDGVAFIVELGPTLSPDEAIRHADAVRTIAAEG